MQSELSPPERIRAPAGIAEAIAPTGILRGLLASTRPRQWVKNLLVLAALVFARRLGDPAAVAAALSAFAAFTLASAGTYLINDVLDLPRDRLHPAKQRRPIAAGVVPPGLALATAAILMGAALTTSWTVNRAPLTLAVIGYIALTIAYSVWLKHIPIVDVIALSAGYVLRAAAGAIAIAVPASHWLLLCTLLLAVFIGIAKRRQELTAMQDGVDGHRPILTSYTVLLLDQMVALAGSATLIAYAMYTLTLGRRASVMLVATFPFVLYGLFRYLWLVYHAGAGATPEDAIFSDPPLLSGIAMWGMAVVGVLYWPG